MQQPKLDFDVCALYLLWLQNGYQLTMNLLCSGTSSNLNLDPLLLNSNIQSKSHNLNCLSDVEGVDQTRQLGNALNHKMSDFVS